MNYLPWAIALVLAVLLVWTYWALCRESRRSRYLTHWLAWTRTRRQEQFQEWLVERRVLESEIAGMRQRAMESVDRAMPPQATAAVRADQTAELPTGPQERRPDWPLLPGMARETVARIAGLQPAHDAHHGSAPSPTAPRDQEPLPG